MKFKMYHENYNVSNLDKSLDFYEKALGLHEKRRINGEGFIIVFVGNDEKGYRYVIGSSSNSLDILTQLKSLKSKGGGSKDMIQGFTPASKTELLKALS